MTIPREIMVDAASLSGDSKGKGSAGYARVDLNSTITSEEMKTKDEPQQPANKCKTILSVAARIIAALGLLYIFICSLDILAAAFRLLGGKAAGEIFGSPLLKNPIVGMVIGILVTVLVQSSSTSTSLIVSMVTAGYLPVKQSVPMIMGANIGTSITNTLVSFSQVADREEFRRAFAAATVHDMFNWMSVIVLLPIEIAGHMIYHITGVMTESLAGTSGSAKEIKLLKVITEPLTGRVIQLDSKVLQAWSLGDENDPRYNLTTMMKDCNKSTCDPESYLFEGVNLSDAAVGGILLAISLVVMSGCLILLVKVLNSILQGQISVTVNKVVNYEVKSKYWAWVPGYLAIAVGAVMTFLVQSSSVFTSAITPLAGMGLISLDRMYPLCLGSNIGTTSTALLAALASDSSHLHDSLQAALCHMVFNILGIMLFYVIPFMRVPVTLAKGLGDITARYRWFAIAYLVGMFLIFPLIVFALSQGGEGLLLAVLIPVILIILSVVIINAVRDRKPALLPGKLREGWEFMPAPLRSLEFYDRAFSKMPRFRKNKLTTSATSDSPVISASSSNNEGVNGWVNQGFTSNDDRDKNNGLTFVVTHS